MYYEIGEMAVGKGIEKNQNGEMVKTVGKLKSNRNIYE
jgi:hypothetical protein